jgi:steroid delta-isomerase-like uncharacterized protein
MSVQENKQLVRTFYETAYIEHDMDAAGEMLSNDYRLHDPMRPDFGQGVDAFKQAQWGYIGAMQDHTITIDDQFGESDRVVTRWTATGTQKDDLPGIPNHGKCFKVSGITISRVSDGKITEEWNIWDAAGLAGQLGGD